MAAFICSFQPPSVLMAGFRSWAARRSPDQVTSQLPMEHSREFRAAESRVTNWSNCENLPSAVVVTCKHPESPLRWTNRKQDCQIVKKNLANWWIFLQCLYRWCPVAQRECNLARTAYSAPESLEIMASPWNRGQANSLPCRVNLKWSFVEIQIVWDAVELHLSIILFNGGLICLFIILGKSLTPNQLCSFPYCNLQLTLSIDALHHESR